MPFTKPMISQDCTLYTSFNKFQKNVTNNQVCSGRRFCNYAIHLVDNKQK